MSFRQTVCCLQIAIEDSQILRKPSAYFTVSNAEVYSTFCGCSWEPGYFLLLVSNYSVYRVNSACACKSRLGLTARQITMRGQLLVIYSSLCAILNLPPCRELKKLIKPHYGAPEIQRFFSYLGCHSVMYFMFENAEVTSRLHLLSSNGCT